MANDLDLEKEFETGLSYDENQPTPEEAPEKVTETPENPAEPKAEEPKEDPVIEDTEAGEPKTEEPEGEDPKPTETPEAEGEQAPAETSEEEPEPATPLTKDDIKSVISEMRNEDKTSTQQIETAVNDVLEEYYPDGLSNVLVDETTGKELRTPQDVVDVSGGEWSMEQASQWLINEQFKLDKSISEIKDSAKNIAETTLKFKQDSETVLKKYEPLFKKYPYLQEQTADHYFENLQKDKTGKFVQKAPDMIKFYDFVLDPYRMAFEQSQQQAATAAVDPPKDPETPKPTTEDRMDITGDGGATDTIDPNDFAANLKHELNKGA